MENPPVQPSTKQVADAQAVTATQSELAAAAFTEWERRFREEPERFRSEAVRLLRDTPETYGEACAPYLIAILDGTV